MTINGKDTVSGKSQSQSYTKRKIKKYFEEKSNAIFQISYFFITLQTKNLTNHNNVAK